MSAQRGRKIIRIKKYTHTKKEREVLTMIGRDVAVVYNECKRLIFKHGLCKHSKTNILELHPDINNMVRDNNGKYIKSGSKGFLYWFLTNNLKVDVWEQFPQYVVNFKKKQLDKIWNTFTTAASTPKTSGSKQPFFRDKEISEFVLCPHYENNSLRWHPSIFYKPSKNRPVEPKFVEAQAVLDNMLKHGRLSELKSSGMVEKNTPFVTVTFDNLGDISLIVAVELPVKKESHEPHKNGWTGKGAYERYHKHVAESEVLMTVDPNVAGLGVAIFKNGELIATRLVDITKPVKRMAALRRKKSKLQSALKKSWDVNKSERMLRGDRKHVEYRRNMQHQIVATLGKIADEFGVQNIYFGNAKRRQRVKGMPNFGAIGYAQIHEYMKEMCCVKGILLEFVHEGYTSVTSFLDGETPNHAWFTQFPSNVQEAMRKRRNKHEFTTNTGIKCHADINAACQIGVKYGMKPGNENLTHFTCNPIRIVVNC